MREGVRNSTLWPYIDLSLRPALREFIPHLIVLSVSAIHPTNNISKTNKPATMFFYLLSMPLLAASLVAAGPTQRPIAGMTSSKSVYDILAAKIFGLDDIHSEYRTFFFQPVKIWPLFQSVDLIYCRVNADILPPSPMYQRR
jgi:hypothetical protein